MKIIRDTIHGDIELEDHEIQLIHTREFQRLNGCRQLGLAYLVYPGAKHSRFEHVLGVMHVASRIAKRLYDHNGFFKAEFDSQLEKTLRMAALLHDMGHVPFGHTFEDEMPVITKHDSASIGTETSRMEVSVTDVLRSSGNSGMLKPVLRVLEAIAKSGSDDKLYEWANKERVEPIYLVLADIIGNTICADLLDYISRDHLMCGIRGVYDDRIFQYFDVGNHRHQSKEHPRLIINLVKNGRVRHDCLADLLDILKLRYNLSDKVLFHPQKCAAGAMIIRAKEQIAELSESELMKLSDDGLLDEYEEHPLVRLLRSRKLFKPVFIARMEHIHGYNEASTKKDSIEQNLHRNSGVRQKIENGIKKIVGLPEAQTSVLIYCPRPSMSLKSVRVLVRWSDGTIRRLNSIEKDDAGLTYDQVRVLEGLYPGLWKLYLFVQPELRSRGHQIREAFVRVLKEETGLDATCDPAFANYLENGCPEYAIGRRLDEQLLGTRPYQDLASSGRAWVVAECHHRLGLSVDHINGDSQVLAARKDDRALMGLITETIGLVMGEATSRTWGD